MDGVTFGQTTIADLDGVYGDQFADVQRWVAIHERRAAK